MKFILVGNSILAASRATTSNKGPPMILTFLLISLLLYSPPSPPLLKGRCEKIAPSAEGGRGYWKSFTAVLFTLTADDEKLQ